MGRWEGIKRGKGEGFSGICIKDTWTKPRRGRIKMGRWGWLGWGGLEEGKGRQLYLNNNKIFKKGVNIPYIYGKNMYIRPVWGYNAVPKRIPVG